MHLICSKFVIWSAEIGWYNVSAYNNDIISQEDWWPTLLAAAGVPDIKEKLKTGYRAGGKTF
jgi:hypothetical protein